MAAKQYVPQWKVDTSDPSYQPLSQMGQESASYDQPYIQSLEKQTTELQNVPQKLQQAFEVGKSNLQQQAAQSLARTGVVRGGRGLAAGRSTAIESGRAIAGEEQKSQLAQQDALQKAAQAQTSLLGEKKKLAQAKVVKAAQVQSAIADAQRILTDVKGSNFYVTGNDLNKAKQRLQQEVLIKYADNPEAMAAAVNAFNSSAGGAHGASAWDIFS